MSSIVSALISDKVGFLSTVLLAVAPNFFSGDRREGIDYELSFSLAN
jgi:hypothetical protein